MSVPNFIRLKCIDPKRKVYVTVNAAAINGYGPYGEQDQYTEVMLECGRSYVTAETISEFEIRLNYAIKPFIID